MPMTGVINGIVAPEDKAKSNPLARQPKNMYYCLCGKSLVTILYFSIMFEIIVIRNGKIVW